MKNKKVDSLIILLNNKNYRNNQNYILSKNTKHKLYNYALTTFVWGSDTRIISFKNLNKFINEKLIFLYLGVFIIFGLFLIKFIYNLIFGYFWNISLLMFFLLISYNLYSYYFNIGKLNNYIFFKNKNNYLIFKNK